MISTSPTYGAIRLRSVGRRPMEIRWCDSSNWSDGWITDPPLRPRLDRTIRRKWMTYEKHLSNACVIRHLRVVFGPQGRCAKIPVPRAVRCVGTGFCPCSSCVHIMNLTLRMAPFLKKYFPLVGWLLYSTREKIKMSTIAIHMTMNRPVQDRSKQNRQTPEKIIIITTTTTTEITTMTVRRRTYWTLITGMTCQVKPITMHSMIRLDMLLFRHRPILTAVLHPTRVLRMGTPHRMLIRRLRTVHLLKDNIRMLLFPRGVRRRDILVHHRPSREYRIPEQRLPGHRPLRDTDNHLLPYRIPGRNNHR